MDIQSQAKPYTAHLEDASMSKSAHYELEDASSQEASQLESYLMARHGRTDLVPLPTADPHDPYNWSKAKKHLVLAVVSLHAMSMTITAASAIPAFETFAEVFDVTLSNASYTVTVVIGVSGVAPFFWQPLADRWGRRPIYLISALCTAVCCLGGAFCKSYGTMMLTRALSSFFVSTAVSIGAATVGEVFFRHEKGQKMGVWILCIGLGPVVAPLVMGAVITHLSWHWVFYLLTMLQGLIFVLHLVLVPETLYPRPTPGQAEIEKPVPKTTRQQYFGFGRINHTPLTAYDFVRPWEMAKHMDIILPSISYALVFAYTGVLMTVEIPQLFGQKFELTAQGIGLQFIAPLIGSLIGEQIGGPFSDWYINSKAKKAGYRKPEMRLPVSWLGFLLACVGAIEFGVTLQNASAGPWSARAIVPLIGSALALVGSQIITTVLVTYAVESHAHSGRTGDVSLIISCIRQLWAFLSPFYYTSMFANLGVAKAIGVLGALNGASILPILYLQWRARNNRGHIGSD